MFCQSCGAKNTDNARFCNMCGTRIAPPGAPGGMVAGPTAQGVASLDLPIGSVRVAGASEPPRPSSSPSIDPPAIEHKPKTPELSGPREIAAASGGTIAMGSKEASDRAAPSAPQRAAPPAPDRPDRGSAENVWEHHDESRSNRSFSGSIPNPTGYLPSSSSQSMASVSLAAIGVQSRNRTWMILIGGAILFVGLGAIGMYAVMKNTSGETAHASEGALGRNDPPETIPDEDSPIVVGIPEGADIPDDDVGPRGESTSMNDTSMATTMASDTAMADPTASEGTMASTMSESTMSESTMSESTMTATMSESTMTATMSETTMEPEVATMTEDPGGEDSIPEGEGDDRDLEFELYVGRVRYAIRRYYAARAQSCFEHATRNDPSLRGTVTLRFSIMANGNVTNSSVLRNTTGNESLGRCLANQALTWRLPQTYNGETIPLEIPFSR
jgi:hypothetical protein